MEVRNFRLHVVSAKDLYNTNPIAKQEPYVKISLGRKKVKTSVFRNGGSAVVWDFTQTLSWKGEQRIEFEVLDGGTFGGHDFIAEAWIDMSKAQEGFDQDLILQREGSAAGKLNVAIEWMGCCAASEDTASASNEVLVEKRVPAKIESNEIPVQTENNDVHLATAKVSTTVAVPVVRHPLSKDESAGKLPQPSAPSLPTTHLEVCSAQPIAVASAEPLPYRPSAPPAPLSADLRGPPSYPSSAASTPPYPSYAPLADSRGRGSSSVPTPGLGYPCLTPGTGMTSYMSSGGLPSQPYPGYRQTLPTAQATPVTSAVPSHQVGSPFGFQSYAGHPPCGIAPYTGCPPTLAPYTGMRLTRRERRAERRAARRARRVGHYSCGSNSS